MYIFCPRLGTKTSLTKLFLKNSVWMLYLPNFFCQVNSWIAILRQHKILSGMYIFRPRLGTKNFFFHSFQGGTKGKMLKNCQTPMYSFGNFSAFFLWSPLGNYEKKSCLNKLKF